VKARGARVFVITDNPRLARGIDDHPIVIPDNGPLTALIAVLPLQVRCLLLTLLYSETACFLCSGATL
jgi:glucosamine--fructose-6-phosphate aminotransferase (isomerizing)